MMVASSSQATWSSTLRVSASVVTSDVARSRTAIRHVMGPAAGVGTRLERDPCAVGRERWTLDTFLSDHHLPSLDVALHQVGVTAGAERRVEVLLVDERHTPEVEVDRPEDVAVVPRREVDLEVGDHITVDEIDQECLGREADDRIRVTGHEHRDAGDRSLWRYPHARRRAGEPHRVPLVERVVEHHGLIRGEQPAVGLEAHAGPRPVVDPLALQVGNLSRTIRVRRLTQRTPARTCRQVQCSRTTASTPPAVRDRRSRDRRRRPGRCRPSRPRRRGCAGRPAIPRYQDRQRVRRCR